MTSGRIAPACALLASTLAIAACGSSGPPTYPANVQTNFLNACEVKGQVAACNCTLTHIEQRVSLSDYQTGEQGIAVSGLLPQWLYDAVASCK
jgi:hypothetical protein